MTTTALLQEFTSVQQLTLDREGCGPTGTLSPVLLPEAAHALIIASVYDTGLPRMLWILEARTRQEVNCGIPVNWKSAIDVRSTERADLCWNAACSVRSTC